MSLLRINVDFNTMMMDPKDRVLLAHENTNRARERSIDILVEGLSIILFDDEMEVYASAQFDTTYRTWLAQPDWTTRRFFEED